MKGKLQIEHNESFYEFEKILFSSLLNLCRDGIIQVIFWLSFSKLTAQSTWLFIVGWLVF